MTRAEMRRWLAATTLTRRARAVFLTLCCHADGAGYAWPSVATLARESGWGTTLTRAALRELEEHGDIERRANGRGEAAVYRVDPNRRVLGSPQQTGVGVVENHPNTFSENPNRRVLDPQQTGVGEGNYLQLQKGADATVAAKTEPDENKNRDLELDPERAAAVEVERRRNALAAIRETRHAIIAGYRQQRHGGTMTDTPTQPDPNRDPQPDPNEPDPQPDPQPSEPDPDQPGQ